MLQVYLAGPISGLPLNDAAEWRTRAKLILDRNGYWCINPIRGKHPSNADQSIVVNGQNLLYGPNFGPKSVFKRDKHDVERSDILLVNLTGATHVSIFTMMELAWAEEWNKFVLTVMEEGNIHEHAAVREASTLVVPTLEDAIKYLTEVHNQ
jgi:nucleoside 2-deoxyribosyltransferase